MTDDLPFDTSESEAPPLPCEFEKRIVALLRNIGDSGTCRGCGAPIYWVTHKNGKKAPYTMTGLVHFIDCPKAKDFKR